MVVLMMTMRIIAVAFLQTWLQNGDDNDHDGCYEDDDDGNVKDDNGNINIDDDNNDAVVFPQTRLQDLLGKMKVLKKEKEAAEANANNARQQHAERWVMKETEAAEANINKAHQQHAEGGFKKEAEVIDNNVRLQYLVR